MALAAARPRYGSPPPRGATTSWEAEVRSPWWSPGGLQEDAGEEDVDRRERERDAEEEQELSGLGYDDDDAGGAGGREVSMGDDEGREQGAEQGGQRDMPLDAPAEEPPDGAAAAAADAVMEPASMAEQPVEEPADQAPFGRHDADEEQERHQPAAAAAGPDADLTSGADALTSGADAAME
eukprot:COSAG04_NODE_1380_length_6999_cov_2.386957_1_plen_180_part_10